MRPSRREALQGLAGSLGAALAGSTAAEAHPIDAHVAQRARSAAATPEPAGPRVLDRHQLALLTIVCDLIVPGSVASRSPQYIHDVLAIETPEIQQRFVGALAAFDAAARDQHQQPFAALPRERQLALLESADADTSGSGLGRQLQHLKTWVAGAHYSSEPGMKELGFTGGMFFAAFPACPHQDGHQ